MFPKEAASPSPSSMVLGSLPFLSTPIAGFITMSDTTAPLLPYQAKKSHPWLSAGHTNMILSKHHRNNHWVSAAHVENIPENTPEKKSESQVR